MTTRNVDKIKAGIGEAWGEVAWVETVGSTNAELLAHGAAGDVLIADEQTAGRGRKGRTWVSPKGAQLCFSVVLEVEPTERIGLLPLLTGLAIADVVPGATLKWPNDVLLAGGKVAGVLAEADFGGERPRVVVGAGINFMWRREDLPVPTATALNLEGVDVDFDSLTVDVLRALSVRVKQWEAGEPQLLADYRAACATIGQQVRLERANGDVEGYVDDVADTGEILIDGTAYSAGDVTHLRPAN